MIYISCNKELLNRVDYKNKNMVKNLIRNHWSLYNDGMMKGDSVSLSIWIDLSRAIRTRGVLTFKQKQYLLLWADGWTLYDIGVKHSTSRQVVHLTAKRGVARISAFLCKRMTNTPQLVYVRGSNFTQSGGKSVKGFYSDKNTCWRCEHFDCGFISHRGEKIANQWDYHRQYMCGEKMVSFWNSNDIIVDDSCMSFNCGLNKARYNYGCVVPTDNDGSLFRAGNSFDEVNNTNEFEYTPLYGYGPEEEDCCEVGDGKI